MINHSSHNIIAIRLLLTLPNSILPRPNYILPHTLPTLILVVPIVVLRSNLLLSHLVDLLIPPHCHTRFLVASSIHIYLLLSHIFFIFLLLCH